MQGTAGVREGSPRLSVGLRVLTPAGCAAQVGGVIGKAGVIVKQVRDETGARGRVSARLLRPFI